MSKRKAKAVDLSCVECGSTKAALVTGADVYPGRQDLANLKIWRCPCGARVGCHKGTEKPKGRPAGPATQAARIRAHAAFDPLWRAKSAKEGLALSYCRGKAYNWLAGQMNLPPDVCHIGMLTRGQAEQVVQIIDAARAAKRKEKANAD